MAHHLYDPRTNISSPVTYSELQGITEIAFSNFSVAKKTGRKIKAINCYITDGPATLTQRREWYAAEIHEGEYWKPLPNTTYTYLISNYGRVKRVFKTTERLLLPYQRKGKGNMFVKIDREDTKVRHLIARAFLRALLPGERVAGKNGIATDDHLHNLEIITKQELGRRTGFKSKSMPVLKIDAKTGETVEEYRSAREAGRKNYFSYQAILDKCNGDSGQSGDFIWRFERDCETDYTSDYEPSYAL